MRGEPNESALRAGKMTVAWQPLDDQTQYV